LEKISAQPKVLLILSHNAAQFCKLRLGQIENLPYMQRNFVNYSLHIIEAHDTFYPNFFNFQEK